MSMNAAMSFSSLQRTPQGVPDNPGMFKLIPGMASMRAHASREAPKSNISCLVNFRHLKALIAVAELCSVTKASEHLYKAQSAITRSILALEDALQVELFERRTSGMLCNAFGSALLYRATRALAEFESGINEVSGKTRESSHALNLHFPNSLFNETRLEAFVKLAETGHMPTVAKDLRITQSAVSRAINGLERNLDLRLFRRTFKGMVLTEKGELLFFRVKRALFELHQVETDFAALKGTTRGRVVVGALPLGRTSILPKAIAAVLREHPQLQIATVEGPYDSLASKLRSGDIDFILGALRPADQVRDFTGEPLFNESVSIVVRAGHPLSHMAAPTLADLTPYSWILPNSCTPARKQLDLAFKLEDLVPPLPAVETSDLALLRGVLLDTDQVTAISACQVEYEIRSGMLTVLDIPLPTTTRVIGLTQRADSNPSPGAKALMAAIRRMVYDGEVP